MVQENARLRSAVAVAQQQLYEDAEAAEGRALGEAAQALQGEQQAVQQAHLLVPTYLLAAFHQTSVHSDIHQSVGGLSVHAWLACLPLCMC